MNDINEFKKRIKCGVYRHFKGNLYEVLGFAYHSEDMSVMVVYKALYGDMELWVRDARMWEEYVVRDGVKMKRFEYIGGDGSDAESAKNNER